MAALCALAAAACGAPTVASSSTAAQAHLMQVDELAAGKLDALPTGTQFVRVQLFRQTPGSSFPSKKHQVGIIYQETGTQLLKYEDGTYQGIPQGTALYLESIQHSHTNNGPATNAWYNFALWPSPQRAAPLTAAGATIPFETADIPSTDLQPGSYVETLRKVTLGSGGRSPSHRFGGLEVIFVLDGSLTVDERGQQPDHLDAGQGVYVGPGTVSQELAAGGAATYLAFFVTEQDQAFETLVSSTP